MGGLQQNKQTVGCFYLQPGASSKLVGKSELNRFSK